MQPDQTGEFVQLVVPLAKSLQKRLKVLAVMDERSLKDIVTEAIVEYVERRFNESNFAVTGPPTMARAAHAERGRLTDERPESWSEYRTPGEGKPFSVRLDSGSYVLNMSGLPRIDRSFIETIREHFARQTVVGGFNMTNPPKGGLGFWVDQNSASLNSRKLGPRHACFVAGILVRDYGVEAFLEGPHDRVMLRFPQHDRGKLDATAESKLE